MEITIIIKGQDGRTIELSKVLSSLNDKDIIGSVESNVSAIRQELLPELSSKLVEQHQLQFKGKKIKKKNGSDIVTIYSLNGSFFGIESTLCS